jgi:hypothetical protein
MRTWIIGGLALLAATGAQAEVDRYSAGFYYDKVMVPRPAEGHGNGQGAASLEKGAGQEQGPRQEDGRTLEQATVRSYALGYIDGYVNGRQAVSNPVCSERRQAMLAERTEELLEAEILRLRNERTNWAGTSYVKLIADLLQDCSKLQALPTLAASQPEILPDHSAGFYYDTVIKGEGRKQAIAQTYVHGYVAGQVNGRMAGPQSLCPGNWSDLRPGRVEELLRARILRLRSESGDWKSTSYTSLIAELVVACGRP